MNYRHKHYVEVGLVVLLLAGALMLLDSWRDAMAKEDVAEMLAYQEEHCPTSLINPEGLAQGDIVKIVVSGERGQVIEPVRYAYEGSRGPLRKSCVTEPFQVRVGHLNAAEESGTSDTSKSDLMPILEFEHFEITRWTDE